MSRYISKLWKESFVKVKLETLFWLFLGSKNTLNDDLIISNTYGPPAITDPAE